MVNELADERPPANIMHKPTTDNRQPITDPMDFTLTSEFLPTGDQPDAIRQLVEGVNSSIPYQTLLGVTGSGKTFTIANVIQQVQRPTLVLSHNKNIGCSAL